MGFIWDLFAERDLSSDCTDDITHDRLERILNNFNCLIMLQNGLHRHHLTSFVDFQLILIVTLVKLLQAKASEDPSSIPGNTVSALP